ncbi:MAG: MoxR family ATPase, partial [Planctomycetia bacterium]|nr:MoxR family ATPase [Planctomycetia bacterium]
SETAKIVRQTTVTEEPHAEKAMDVAEILKYQDIVRQVLVADYVLEYICDLVACTRPVDEKATEMVKKYVDWGGSPRAAQNLTLGAKARAVLNGNFSASCDDVRAIARQVFRHRVALNYAAEAEGVNIEDVLTDLLKRVPEPKE